MQYILTDGKQADVDIGRKLGSLTWVVEITEPKYDKRQLKTVQRRNQNLNLSRQRTRVPIRTL